MIITNNAEVLNVVTFFMRLRTNGSGTATAATTAPPGTRMVTRRASTVNAGSAYLPWQ